jgi:hypothetical protein
MGSKGVVGGRLVALVGQLLDDFAKKGIADCGRNLDWIGKLRPSLNSGPGMDNSGGWKTSASACSGEVDAGSPTRICAK